jgi:predicted XRE-type DNA-binding protein
MSLQQFWTFILDYGGAGLIAVVIIVGVSAIVKMWPMLVKFISVGSAVADLPETLATLTEKTEKLETTLQIIKKEVLPNGGSSLRDAVNRVEVNMQEVSKVVETHTRKLEGGNE